MYVIREVLHCKPGKVRQMVEKFRQISAVLKDMGQEPMRLLTDVTGEPSGPSSLKLGSRRSMTSSQSSRSLWPTRPSGEPWPTTTISSTAGGGKSFGSRAES
jgi:hypothetical protein